MTELLVEFAFEIILLLVAGAATCFFTYLKNLHKKIGIVDARSLRLSTAFLHYVKRSDELHSNREGTPDQKLSVEVENLLKDPKTGKL